jgi:hypothetical protein
MVGESSLIFAESDFSLHSLFLRFTQQLELPIN